jgi:hypothetical protein
LGLGKQRDTAHESTANAEKVDVHVNDQGTG